MSKTRLLEAVKQLDFETTSALIEARPSLLTVTDREGRGLLHLACSVAPGSVELPDTAPIRLVEYLLDRGLEIDTPVGRDACTPLFFAVARARSAALVRMLLVRGASVTATPGGGLFAAGWWEDLEILDILLRAGAPIDVVAGITPFLACWGWRRFEAAKYLAEKGADVNYQDAEGRTALHLGLEKEYDPALLRWLVQHGASCDIEDHNGVTPRLKASRKRDKRFLTALEGAGSGG